MFVTGCKNIDDVVSKTEENNNNSQTNNLLLTDGNKIISDETSIIESELEVTELDVTSLSDDSELSESIILCKKIVKGKQIKFLSGTAITIVAYIMMFSIIYSRNF